jgi:hemerythrin-like domain-containing protein
MEEQNRAVRRHLVRVAAASAGVFLAGRTMAAEKDGVEGAVSPLEDLMREHGLINRALLVYEEALRRVETPGADLDPGVVLNTARFFRNFAEDYHEKLEEHYVFPQFDKAGLQVPLVQILLRQHNAGRQITDNIQQLANLAALRDAAARRRLAALLQQYVRMYRPHTAREDTVLFPMLEKLVGRHEYLALGDKFESEERLRFGTDGFARVAEQVAGFERAVGIFDLAQFTPR